MARPIVDSVEPRVLQFTRTGKLVVQPTTPVSEYVTSSRADYLAVFEAWLQMAQAARTYAFQTSELAARLLTTDPEDALVLKNLIKLATEHESVAANALADFYPGIQQLRAMSVPTQEAPKLPTG